MAVEIRIREDRLDELITVDEWIEFVRGDWEQNRNVLARFVMNGNGDYMEYSEALRVIGTLPRVELKRLRYQFLQMMSEAASSPQTGAA